MFIIVLGQRVSILIESSSGPSKKGSIFLEGSEDVSILIESSSGPSKKGSIFLEGPEDDSIKIETVCPSTMINIVKFCCV